MNLTVVSPLVPEADGKVVISRNVVIASIFLLFALAIRRIVGCSGVNVALERNSGSVRAPDRRSGARHQRRDALRLAGSSHVEDVDLIRVVAVAFGREREPAPVRAPGRVTFGCGRAR